MLKFLVPFQMHKTGWVLVGCCALVGVRLDGWRLGLLLGALLVVSLLLHEVGHMMVARLLGVPVHEFGLRLLGAYNRREYAGSRRDEILISAAGPVTNLLMVVPLFFVPLIGIPLALCNLELGIFNLLPIPQSDGLRILRTAWRWRAPEPASSIAAQAEAG